MWLMLDQDMASLKASEGGQPWRRLGAAAIEEIYFENISTG